MGKEKKRSNISIKTKAKRWFTKTDIESTDEFFIGDENQIWVHRVEVVSFVQRRLTSRYALADSSSADPGRSN